MEQFISPEGTKQFSWWHDCGWYPYTGAGSGITRALKFTPDIKFVNDETLNEFVVTVERKDTDDRDDNRDDDREDREKRDKEAKEAKEAKDNSLSTNNIGKEEPEKKRRR